MAGVKHIMHVAQVLLYVGIGTMYYILYAQYRKCMAFLFIYGKHEFS